MSLWWIRLLNWLGLRSDVLTCMRQSETWCWGDDLGARTAGKCVECGEPIFFERQNSVFRRKVCNRCAPPRWHVFAFRGDT